MDLRDMYINIVDNIYKDIDILDNIDSFFNKANRDNNKEICKYQRLIWLPYYIDKSINVMAMEAIENILNVPIDKRLQSYKL